MIWRFFHVATGPHSNIVQLSFWDISWWGIILLRERRRYLTTRLSLFPIVVVIFGVHANTSYAAPWAQQNGALLAITRIDYFQTEFTDSDPQTEDVEFRRLETNSYFEYGVSEKTLLSGKVVYGTTSFDGPQTSASFSGFTEVEFGVQTVIYAGKKDILSLRGAFSLPPSASSGVRQNFTTGGVDVEPSVLYGITLADGPRKVFGAAQLGYKKRFGDAADLIRNQLTIGIEPSPRWLLLADTFADISLQNENPGGVDYDVLKVQPSIVYRTKRRWSLQLGVTEEIAGRNVGSLGRTFFVGLWSSF